MIFFYFTGLSDCTLFFGFSPSSIMASQLLSSYSTALLSALFDNFELFSLESLTRAFTGSYLLNLLLLFNVVDSEFSSFSIDANCALEDFLSIAKSYYNDGYTLFYCPYIA
jgi:hypothetical protein